MENFSKKFIKTISVMFICVVAWAMFCVTFKIGSVEYINVPVEVMGLVMTSGTLGYLIKSAMENKKKIEMNPNFLENAQESNEPEEANDVNKGE